MVRQILLSSLPLAFVFSLSLLQVQISEATQAGMRPNQDRVCGLPNFQQELIQQMQNARSRSRYCGNQFFKAAPGVRWNDKLTSAATGHSADMANRNYFSHQSLDGSIFSQRITRAGYRWTTVGENISAGRRSVMEVMNAWMHSPHHCANIMAGKFLDVGIACVKNDHSQYNYYWSMELGRGQ